MQRLDDTLAHDSHLALAHYLLGLCYFHTKAFVTSPMMSPKHTQLSNHRHAKAITSFHHALEELHEHPFIDYKQLGLVFKLYACELNHNMCNN